MATHSITLAWKIPGMGKPGGSHLWGRTESDTAEATQQQQQQQQQHVMYGVRPLLVWSVTECQDEFLLQFNWVLKWYCTGLIFSSEGHTGNTNENSHPSPMHSQRCVNHRESISLKVIMVCIFILRIFEKVNHKTLSELSIHLSPNLAFFKL